MAATPPRYVQYKILGGRQAVFRLCSDHGVVVATDESTGADGEFE
jgi:hypothetical protein